MANGLGKFVTTQPNLAGVNLSGVLTGVKPRGETDISKFVNISKPLTEKQVINERKKEARRLGLSGFEFDKFVRGEEEALKFAEEINRPDPSLGQSIGQVAQTLGRSLTFGALDTEKQIIEPIAGPSDLGPTDPTIESAFGFVGEAAIIGGVGKFVTIAGKALPAKAIADAVFTKPFGRELIKKIAPAIKSVTRGATSGTLFEGAKQIISDEGFNLESIAKSAAFWAGLDLGGLAISQIAKALSNVKTNVKIDRLSKQAEVLKEELEKRGAPVRPKEIHQQFLDELDQVRGAVPGPAGDKQFIINPKTGKLTTAKIVTPKDKPRFIRNPKGSGKELRFWAGQNRAVAQFEKTIKANASVKALPAPETRLALPEPAPAGITVAPSITSETQFGARRISGVPEKTFPVTPKVDVNPLITAETQIGRLKLPKPTKAGPPAQPIIPKTATTQSEAGSKSIADEATVRGSSSAVTQTNVAENVTRDFLKRGQVSADATQARYESNLRNLRKTGRTANTGWLDKGDTFEKDSATKEFFGLFMAPHERLAKNERIWRLVYDAQNAIDRSGAFYENIFQQAEKAGIKRLNKADQTIWEILNTVDGKKILTQPLEKAVPRDLLNRLTPEQRAFVKTFKEIQNELAEIRGLPNFRFISEYVTWMRKDGARHAYKDIQNVLNRLQSETKKGVSRKIFDPFAQRRVTKGGDLINSSLESMRAYTFYGLKKGFKEPVVDLLARDVQLLGQVDPGKAAYAERWIRDWAGKGANDFAQLNNMSKLLTSQIYKGALFGNVSAALTNSTQTLTATLPEIGAYWTGKGGARLLTNAGRKEFLDTGIMVDLMHGRKINVLDVFTRVEYYNRGTAYLGAKSKGLAQGMSVREADRFARDVVEKTQFFLLGKASAPELFRQKGLAGAILRPPLQFTQYPLGMGKRIVSWGKNNPRKLIAWTSVNVALGGPQALLPFDGMAYMLLSPNQKDFLEKWRRNYSLSGLIGVNLAPRFGAGIIPSARQVGSVAGAFVKDSFNLAMDVLNRTTSEELDLDFQRDIVQSNLVQRDLPLLIKGGAQLKKFADRIGLPFSKYRYEDGKIIRRKDNQILSESSVTDRIKGAFIGEPLQIAGARELISATRKRDKATKRAIRETVVEITRSFTQSKKEDRRRIVKQSRRKLFSLGIVTQEAQDELILNQILRERKNAAIRFAESASEEDRIKFLLELQKIKVLAE